MTGRTYAKKGKTPGLTVSDTKRYRHLSVSAFIGQGGQLHYHVQEESFKGKDIALQLEDHFGGRKRKKAIIAWDNATIHKSSEIKEYLRQDKQQRVWLSNIPPYAPEFNPTELLWAYLKGVSLVGIVCKNLTELKEVVIKKLEEIKRNKKLIISFFKHPKVCFI